MKNKTTIFNELVKECEDIMKDCGFTLPTNITYSLNKRFTRTVGRCTRKSKNVFKIEYAKNYLDGYLECNDYMAIKDTILHEMCHALPNGFNHGEVWKRYAKVINDKYGFDIQRLHEYDAVSEQVREKVKRNASPKATVECNVCSREYKVSSTGKIIKNLSKYRCMCGGNLRKV